MIEIELEQGTPEWHEFRRNHIGASDAAPIMGVSPYKTIQELWLEKKDQSHQITQTSSMRFGNENEEFIRCKMSEALGCKLFPKVFTHPYISYMSASIDGIDTEKKIVVEIKCANKQDHELAKQGIVPEKYYPQLQHIMEVCGYGSIYYCSYHKNDLIYFSVENDFFYIKKMVEEQVQFWICLSTNEQPKMEDNTSKQTKQKTQYQEKEDAEWDMLAGQWKKLQSEKKLLLKKEELMKNSLIALTSGEN